MGTVGVAVLAVPLVCEDSHSPRQSSRAEDNQRLDAAAPFRFLKPFLPLPGKVLSITQKLNSGRGVGGLPHRLRVRAPDHGSTR